MQQSSLLSFGSGKRAISNGTLQQKNSDEENLTIEESVTRKPAKTRSQPTDSQERVVPFSEFCTVLENIENTTKRLQITDYLKSYFVDIIKTAPSVLLPSVYLCVNSVGPEYEGLELGLGESLLMKALGGATGRTMQTVKAEARRLGDLGKVAEQSRNTQSTMFKPKPLTVQSVYKTLREIAQISGQNSNKFKIDKVQFLFVSGMNNEVKYVMRMLEGKLRIGLAAQSVLIALAQATHATKYGKENDVTESVNNVKSVFNQVPNFDIVIPKLLEVGPLEISNHCTITPGIPLKPMLAHPTKSISQVLTRFENIPFTCEYKYDGERAQIHYLDSGKISIYSRNLENMTQKYPDILNRISQIIKPTTSSFILDCEVVAYNVKEDKIMPFQVLSTRKRKDVSVQDIEVQVCLFAFDILLLNNQSLLKHSLRDRREALYSAFQEIPGIFQFAVAMNSTSVNDIEMFLDASVKGNCEGLMVKTLDQDSSYEPSKRSRNWLKVKKDYVNGVGDSLDLVVIGGYQGRGKRTGVYGGFLLACYDPDNEEYQAICKIGTGFSDEDLATHSKFFADHISDGPKQYYQFHENTKPDVWFDPVQVWEVKAADFSISPIYLAARGLVDETKGISLRFPRFLRIRDDKKPEEGSTSDFVAELYNQQETTKEPALADGDY